MKLFLAVLVSLSNAAPMVSTLHSDNPSATVTETTSASLPSIIETMYVSDEEYQDLLANSVDAPGEQCQAMCSNDQTSLANAQEAVYCLSPQEAQLRNPYSGLNGDSDINVEYIPIPNNAEPNC